MPSTKRHRPHSAPNRAAIALFGPDACEDVIANFKARLRNEVQKPEAPSDLRTFAFEVRRIISDNPNALWLLNPVEPAHAAHYQVSVRCASIIKARVAVGDVTWPKTLYEVLHMMERLSPEPWDQSKVPKRSEFETMSEYLERFTHWVACFLPEAVMLPSLVRRLAVLAWSAHGELYDLNVPELSNSFNAKRAEFRTIEEVKAWFLDQRSLQPALRHANGSECSGSRFVGSTNNKAHTRVPYYVVHSAGSQEPDRIVHPKGPAQQFFWDTFVDALKRRTEDYWAHASSVTPAKTEADKPPGSYAKAIKARDAVSWKNACDAAMNTISSRGVWELVDKPQHAHVLTSHWVFERPLADAGHAAKYSAQLVAHGSEQRRGEEYGETSAEAVSKDVVYLILAVAAAHGWRVEQVHVKAAFLYGDLEHEIYMQQPEGYKDGTKRVCRLKKALPGLKQAPRQWFLKVSAFLKDLGFRKVVQAPGLFVRSIEDRNTYVLVYAGQLLIASSTQKEMRRVLSAIGNAFEINRSESQLSYLGLHIEQTASGLAIDVRKNITKVLDQYRDVFQSYVLRGATPILLSDSVKAVRLSQNERNDLLLDGSTEAVSPEAARQYRSAVGSLAYIAERGRPDMLFAASQLKQYSAAPRKLHWRMLMRALKYLDASKDARLSFNRQEYPNLQGYSAASLSGEYAKVPHGGYLLFYGTSLIKWVSRPEREVCASAREASLRCALSALEYGQWARSLLVNLGEMNSGLFSILRTDMPNGCREDSAEVRDEVRDEETKRRMAAHGEQIYKYLNSALFTLGYRDVLFHDEPDDVLAAPLCEPVLLDSRTS